MTTTARLATETAWMLYEVVGWSLVIVMSAVTFILWLFSR